MASILKAYIDSSNTMGEKVSKRSLTDGLILIWSFLGLFFPWEFQTGPPPARGIR